jgi:hypothetical protein
MQFGCRKAGTGDSRLTLRGGPTFFFIADLEFSHRLKQYSVQPFLCFLLDSRKNQEVVVFALLKSPECPVKN